MFPSEFRGVIKHEEIRAIVLFYSEDRVIVA